MTVHELGEALAAAAASGEAPALQLVDVREEWEAEVASLPGFRLLPLSRAEEWAPGAAGLMDPAAETVRPPPDADDAAAPRLNRPRPGLGGCRAQPSSLNVDERGTGCTTRLLAQAAPRGALETSGRSCCCACCAC
jgi:hypothetical protein